MAKKLTKSKASKILHDKEVHGHPLTEQQRKFFGAIAGGAEPYKAQIGTMLTALPSNMMDRLSDALGFPQKAVTKLVTGKYQTPSEALGIQNAAGAFLTDVVLDPLGLLGIGAAKKMGALDNVYNINPFAKKTLSDPNKSYRVAGMDAYDDFVESGFLRSKTPMPQSGMSFAEKMKQRPTAFPSFQKGFADLRYLPKEGGVVFETSLPTFKRGEINPVTGFPVKGRHYAHRVVDPETGKTLSRIPAKDIKVFEPKPHWLRGYKEVKPPKKKQDGGWLDKYDAPQAQNGIEGTMGGLTDVGFNYNGAWGGTMQMGGVLPGAVGFTYARTAGAAPANGPYAKKTKASAQDGEKVAKEWLKNWYEERKTLPEFENIASKRIEALEKVPAVQLEPAPEMRKRGMLAAYIPAKKSIIAADPSTMMEGYDPELGVSPYVLGHEMIHALDYMAPQSGRDAPSYPKVDFVSEKASGMSRPEYSWITSGAFPGTKTEVNAVLYGLRQAEGLKGNQPTTPNQMKSIIDKYKNLGEKELNPKTKEGTMNLQIKNLLDVMGNDPEKLSELNNRIVKGKGKAATTAQNGQEMKYYQAGLDFTPKTISQDGSDLRLIPRATGDLRGPKIDVKKEQLAAAAKKNQAAREAIERQGEIKPYVPQSNNSKTWEIATNPVEALGYVVRGERLPENFSKGQSRTSGLNAIVNTLNPYQIIDSGVEFVKGTGNIIKDVATGDIESASSRVPSTILQGLGAAPMLTAFPKGSITRGLQTLSDLPKARTVKEVIGRTGGVPSETSIPRMAMDEVKALRQVQEIGRLKATGARSEEQMRYALQNNLPEEHFQKVFSRSRKEAEDLLASGFGEQKGKVAQTAEEAVDRETMQIVEDFNNRPVTPELQAQRDRLRAQMRQLDQRRSVSTGDVTNIDRSESTLDALERFRTILANSPDFRTTIGNSGNILLPGQEVATSFVDRLADDINRSINKTITPVRNINRKLSDLFNKYSQDYPYYSGDVLEKVPSLALSSQGNLKNVSKTVEFVPEGVKSGDVFTGSLNTSHSSYLPQLKQVFKYTKGEPQFLGYRPMNDMGFLSQYGYTNKDVAKYLNSEIDEQIKRGIVPKNIQRPFLKKSLGPDRVILPQYGIRQYQEGGDIPVDPMGYWNPENVGGPVIIPSNVITMEGVDQPLLGISDTGDVQYMEPGEDYEFDGEYVTEYPVMQQGGRTPLYVSDPNDPRLKTYQDSLYNYNVGRRLAGVLDADKNLIKVKPGSPYDKVVQTGLKTRGYNLKDNTNENPRGYKNYERVASIMKEYQTKGNKGILPIRIQGYFPNPDNTVMDIITGRAALNLLGITSSRPPGSAHLPQWKKPEQQVTLDPSKAPKKTTTQSKPKPKPPVKKEVPKVETKQQEVMKKPEPVVEKKTTLTDYFQGTPVYAPTPYHGSGAGAFVGYRTPQGDTVFVKPEDYERMAVPKYGREFIESKKKMKNGGVSVNNADAQPIKKLDQLLNFTNYNKPTKGGWLDKYN